MSTCRGTTWSLQDFHSFSDSAQVPMLCQSKTKTVPGKTEPAESLPFTGCFSPAPAGEESEPCTASFNITTESSQKRTWKQTPFTISRSPGPNTSPQYLNAKPRSIFGLSKVFIEAAHILPRSTALASHLHDFSSIYFAQP